MNIKPTDLSPHELEILKFVAAGSCTSEIAKGLELDYKTVVESSRGIKTKLGAEMVAELAALARSFLKQDAGKDL